MKPPSSHNKQTRFNAHLRHYHRVNPHSQRTWEEWIEGKPSESKGSSYWLKITLIIVALLALGGIVAGLVIELQ